MRRWAVHLDRLLSCITVEGRESCRREASAIAGLFVVTNMTTNREDRSNLTNNHPTEDSVTPVDSLSSPRS